MSTDECEKKAAWFHAGIIQGTSCTVSSYYLPNGDLEKTEIDVEVYMWFLIRIQKTNGWGSVPDPWHFSVDPDPDPDPAFFVIDLQDNTKKLILKQFFCLLLSSFR